MNQMDTGNLSYVIEFTYFNGSHAVSEVTARGSYPVSASAADKATTYPQGHG